jgi:Rrf2 family protein
MVTSSRFTVAVHILALLAMEKRSLSSTHIAGSVNTNPVVIRRILGTLSQAGLVTTQLGSEGGATLTRKPEEISLLEVYRATEQTDLFAFHSNQPSQFCPCGSNIQPVMKTVFERVENAMETILAETTIAQVVQDIEDRLITKNN